MSKFKKITAKDINGNYSLNIDNNLFGDGRDGIAIIGYEENYTSILRGTNSSMHKKPDLSGLKNLLGVK